MIFFFFHTTSQLCILFLFWISLAFDNIFHSHWIFAAINNPQLVFFTKRSRVDSFCPLVKFSFIFSPDILHMFWILFHFRKHVWLHPCGIYSQVTCLSRAVHRSVVICSYKILFGRSVTKYIFNKNGGKKSKLFNYFWNENRNLEDPFLPVAKLVTA